MVNSIWTFQKFNSVFLMSADKTQLRQGIFAIISGLLLLLAGVHANVKDLRSIIIGMTEQGLIPIELTKIIIDAVFIIGFLGGIPVIIGGIIHLLRKSKFVANMFIGFGSGISISDFFLFMIMTGPALKLAILETRLERVTEIGTQYTIVALGIIFAFFAILTDPIGVIMGFTAGFLINLAGSLTEVIMIMSFLERIGISRPPRIIVDILKILFLTGVLLLIAGILYGYGRYRLGLPFAWFGTIIFLIPLTIIALGFIEKGVFLIRLILGILGEVMSIVTIVYGSIQIKAKELNTKN